MLSFPTIEIVYRRWGSTQLNYAQFWILLAYGEHYLGFSSIDIVDHHLSKFRLILCKIICPQKLNQLHVQHRKLIWKIFGTKNLIHLMRAKGRRQDEKAVKGKPQRFTKIQFS